MAQNTSQSMLDTCPCPNTALCTAGWPGHTDGTLQKYAIAAPNHEGYHRRKLCRDPWGFGPVLGLCQDDSGIFLGLPIALSWLWPTEGSPVPTRPWRAHRVTACVSHRAVPALGVPVVPHPSALKAKSCLTLTYAPPSIWQILALPALHLRTCLHRTPAAESERTRRLTAQGGPRRVQAKKPRSRAALKGEQQPRGQLGLKQAAG